MNKTYLKLSLDFDFVLIAITSATKDYMLCHKINKALAYNFERVEDHQVYADIDKGFRSFSKFFYFVEQGEIEFYLVNNKCEEGFLIQEMKKVDYFIVIRQYIDDEDLNFLITGLNKLLDVQVAVQVDPLKLKSKENLVI